MAILIIFPVVLQTVINLIMLSVGGWGHGFMQCAKRLNRERHLERVIIMTRGQLGPDFFTDWIVDVIENNSVIAVNWGEIVCWYVILFLLHNLFNYSSYCLLCRAITRTPWSSTSHHGTGQRTSGRGVLSIMHFSAVTQSNEPIDPRISSSAVAHHSGLRKHWMSF